jgi:hypothetical protein
MADIGADYLGGDPAVTAGVGAGGKLAPLAGSLRFKGQVLDDALRGVTVEVTLAKEEIRAASIGSPNQMRTLTRAFVGGALAGWLGAVIGAASGKRDQVLLVACVRDGFEFFCSFAVKRDDGAWLLNAMQSGRKECGEPRLSRVEDLAQEETLGSSERQLAKAAAAHGLRRRSAHGEPVPLTIGRRVEQHELRWPEILSLQGHVETASPNEHDQAPEPARLDRLRPARARSRP